MEQKIAECNIQCFRRCGDQRSNIVMVTNLGARILCARDTIDRLLFPLFVVVSGLRPFFAVTGGFGAQVGFP